MLMLYKHLSVVAVCGK